MQKDYITFQQHIFIILLFVLGSSVLFGVNTAAAQDSWIALILATLFALPMVLIYARILKLFPETDLFGIIDQVFGKIVGKVLVALLTWYALHLCALVLRNFTEYISIVALPETPQVVVMAFLLVITMYLARSKPKTLGQWAVISGITVILLIAFTIILAIKDIDFKNLLPIMPNGPKGVIIGAGQIFTFPFAETVVFLSIGNSIKKEESSYKIYVFAIISSAFIMLLAILRNIVTLGVPMSNNSYFSSFNMARTIHIGDFLSRIEGTISVNLILAGLTKITVSLICAAKGISSLFQIKNFEHMVSPIGLLTMSLCAILYRNTLEMFDFLKYYSIYAIPFQVIIPVIIWITAERYAKKKKSLYESQNTSM
ncbi:GerAB/ArcD/ProY family transporter [Marasmitruncus massiliensis]|uniref:GerAB/ArcD/ProY family transporter n=1 Tax=Marasmitruncus massiliensis TaxID=1944642 RepID=UPI000C7C99B2|nr:endospore germination permease [Marasmitruncus massiliensis]